ncbi:unnamed protein product [Rotaria sp. Silwood2]|nr:unnamed protein product [Rotaria sp. Silwood2]CAF4208109.1 unnamed protein product [Rotaria sp. Silwood2]CAF4356333.1 unnamed protein product [Rotaria sp. Silwood2]
MITASTIYDVGNDGASDDPPCLSYTVVNDPSRNIATCGAGGIYDNGSLFNKSIGGRWIRFVGTGGTIIPLTSPGANHCGAFRTGWFNGTLPSIVGTIVSGDEFIDLIDKCLGTTISMIFDVGNGGASGDPPCSSYTVVNDPMRNIATSGTGGTCDKGPLFNTSIGGRWIRFMGIGGTIIPLISPGVNHCGAFLVGWFNGTLPSIIETIVGGYNSIV